jgi:hypothetical protein
MKTKTRTRKPVSYEEYDGPLGVIEKRASDDPDLRRLKMAMFELNVSVAQLAKRCARNPRRITNLLCGDDRSWPIRAAVNKALKMRVFTKAGSKQKPVDLQKRLGFTINRTEPEDILTLKFFMVQRGLRVGDLARLAKLPPRVLSNVLVGNNHLWPPRTAINRALEMRIFQRPTRKPTVRKPQSTP